MSGTYIALQPTGQTRGYLLDLNREFEIIDPVDPLNYHTTLIYSGVDYESIKKHPIRFPIVGIGHRCEVLRGHDGPVLVLRVFSEQLFELYQELAQYGPPVRHELFYPHITLARKWNDGVPQLRAPVSVWYNSHVVCPLKEFHTLTNVDHGNT